MHEHHQVQHIVNEAVALVKQKGLTGVSLVELGVGEALGFDPVSINLYFESFTEGTLLAGAKLELKFFPAKLLCPKCGKKFIKIKSQIDCPQCQVQGTPTTEGKEFIILRIE